MWHSRAGCASPQMINNLWTASALANKIYGPQAGVPSRADFARWGGGTPACALCLTISFLSAVTLTLPNPSEIRAEETTRG